MFFCSSHRNSSKKFLSKQVTGLPSDLEILSSLVCAPSVVVFVLTSFSNLLLWCFLVLCLFIGFWHIWRSLVSKIAHYLLYWCFSLPVLRTHNHNFFSCSRSSAVRSLVLQEGQKRAMKRIHLQQHGYDVEVPQREVDALRKFDHACIVKVDSYWQHSQTVYILMEHCMYGEKSAFFYCCYFVQAHDA